MAEDSIISSVPYQATGNGFLTESSDEEVDSDLSFHSPTENNSLSELSGSAAISDLSASNVMNPGNYGTVSDSDSPNSMVTHTDSMGQVAAYEQIESLNQDSEMDTLLYSASETNEGEYEISLSDEESIDGTSNTSSEVTNSNAPNGTELPEIDANQPTFTEAIFEEHESHPAIGENDAPNTFGAQPESQDTEMNAANEPVSDPNVDHYISVSGNPESIVDLTNDLDDEAITVTDQNMRGRTHVQISRVLMMVKMTKESKKNQFNFSFYCSSLHQCQLSR